MLPSLFILIALSWIYIALGDVPWVAGLFYRIKPAVTAIVVQATYRIGSRALKNPALWAIAAASFVAIFALNAPFPIIVIGAALIGYLGGRRAPTLFQVGGNHGKATSSFGPALIDDAKPTPEHARFHGGHLARVVAVGALLWAVPLAAAIALFRYKCDVIHVIAGCAVVGLVLEMLSVGA